jgi:hypothetical protein
MKKDKPPGTLARLGALAHKNNEANKARRAEDAKLREKAAHARAQGQATAESKGGGKRGK